MDSTRLAQLAGITVAADNSITINTTDEVTIVAESITVAELDVGSRATQEAPVEAGKCEIPAAVKSDLKKAVQTHLDAGNEMKAEGREQEAKHHFTTAEFLSELQTTLEGGTENDVKHASVKVHSARDEIQRLVPKAVYDFLVPRATECFGGKSLRERFEDAKKIRQGY